MSKDEKKVAVIAAAVLAIWITIASMPDYTLLFNT